MTPQEWAQLWPNACPACKGAGGFTSYDTVDYGSTTAQMTTYEVCDTCAQAGVCPRCGQDIHPESEDAYNDWLFDSDDPCPRCGWMRGKGADDVCPEAE